MGSWLIRLGCIRPVAVPVGSSVDPGPTVLQRAEGQLPLCGAHRKALSPVIARPTIRD
jgi:hypothetical protein